MKKILTVVLALLLLSGLTVSAIAAAAPANGAFVSSPSQKLAPVLVKAENASEECEAEVVITSYANRATLGEAGAAALEAAYADIAAASDLGTLDPAIAALAKELGIPSTDLAVSDLFDISYSDCDTHEDHDAFTITIRPTTAENACGILHYVNGDWELLSCDVKNGEITFVTDDLSPFAIAVHNGLPEGSNVGLIIGICVAVAVVAAAVVVVVILLKKKKNDDNEE